MRLRGGAFGTRGRRACLLLLRLLLLQLLLLRRRRLLLRLLRRRLLRLLLLVDHWLRITSRLTTAETLYALGRGQSLDYMSLT